MDFLGPTEILQYIFEWGSIFKARIQCRHKLWKYAALKTGKKIWREHIYEEYLICFVNNHCLKTKNSPDSKTLYCKKPYFCKAIFVYHLYFHMLYFRTFDLHTKIKLSGMGFFAVDTEISGRSYIIYNISYKFWCFNCVFGKWRYNVNGRLSIFINNILHKNKFLYETKAFYSIWDENWQKSIEWEDLC